MKRQYIFLAILFAIIKLNPASAFSHSMVDWASILNKPPFDDVCTTGRYQSLIDTPTDHLRWSDTNTFIATKYGIATENKAMKDTAATLRNLILSSIPSLAGYVQFSDTNTWISSIYRVEVERRAKNDTAAAIRAALNAIVIADTNNKILYYNSSGRISNRIKKWVGEITPSTATDQTINISSASFSTILGARIEPIYNGNVVWCQLNTVSTSSITLDLYRPNTSLVTILGLNVLQGVPFLTANDLSNIRLHVEVTGY